MVDRRRQPNAKASRLSSRAGIGAPRVGRRPSPPALLFAVSAMWIAVGIFAFVSLTVDWKMVPGIVSVGVGALYLRAALTTVVRRNER